MNKINFFSSYNCPFCLKMDFAVIIKNLQLPVWEEIDIVWNGFGNPKEMHLFNIFGEKIPLPTIIKHDEITEVISGVYGNADDKFTLNLIDNFKMLDSLIKS